METTNGTAVFWCGNFQLSINEWNVILTGNGNKENGSVSSQTSAQYSRQYSGRWRKFPPDSRSNDNPSSTGGERAAFPEPETLSSHRVFTKAYLKMYLATCTDKTKTAAGEQLSNEVPSAGLP